jgi:hypothetical protein
MKSFFFLVCSASGEIRSSYSQPAMKFVMRMLSIFSMMILKWVAISSYAEHVRKLVTCWLSTREKLVTRWLSMRGNWKLEIGAYEKIILAHHEHYQSFSSLPHVTHSSVPFSRPCLTSFVPSLTSLYLCLPAYVPCLMSPFLVSRPLSNVPVFPFLCLCSCPLLLCFPSSVPPSLVLCPLSFILARMRVFLKNIHTLRAGTVQCTCPVSPLSRLCTLSPILCSLCQSWK